MSMSSPSIYRDLHVATLVKARDDELESDDRSASSLASSNLGGAAFANCILGVALTKLRKRYFRQLHPQVGWKRSHK